MFLDFLFSSFDDIEEEGNFFSLFGSDIETDVGPSRVISYLINTSFGSFKPL
jgi:hypothetical protein